MAKPPQASYGLFSGLVVPQNTGARSRLVAWGVVWCSKAAGSNPIGTQHYAIIHQLYMSYANFIKNIHQLCNLHKIIMQSV